MADRPVSVIAALEKYFMACELLKDGAFRIDYLGEKPIEYTIEVLACDPILKRYIDGSSERQYMFAFGSREYYGQERKQNIENSAFYERLSAWVEDNSRAGNLPVLPEGKEARKLEVVSSGFLFGEHQKTGRYQIQLRLTYYQEVKRNG